MKRILGALAIAAAAIPTGASAADTPCDQAGAAPYPLFQTAEAFLKQGSYAEFFGLMVQQELIGKDSPMIRKAVDSLEQQAPAGFSACRVAVQRRDVGGAVQEIVVFHKEGHQSPLFLYLAGMSNGVQDTIMAFRLDNDFRKSVSRLF